MLNCTEKGEEEMAEEKLPTFEEVRAMVGRKKEVVLEIDQNMVRAFCRCIGEPESKWRKEAPPGFLTTGMMSGGRKATEIPVPYRRTVDAGADWEFHKPIEVGDIITTVHEFTDIQDKSSEKGPRALMIFKSTHKNQKGELVAVSTGRLMSF